METTDIIQKFEERAKRYLTEKRIKKVEFSSGTYQIETKDIDSSESVWPFVQFDKNENVTDLFCSCKEAEESPFCEHLAAVLLYIYHSKTQPLHIRFIHSFWNHICSLFAKKYGCEIQLLTRKDDKGFLVKTKEGKDTFSITPLSQHTEVELEEIFVNREVETEETSLKFSNIPQEEIQKWREGRPSFFLRFELSFWGDLAKWLILLQDNEAKYKVSFLYDEDQIPKAVNIEFENIVNLTFTIDKEDLIELIPSLNTIDSPLTVADSVEDDIEAIHYNPENKLFEFTFKEEKSSSQSDLKGHEITLGKWTYLPKIGFLLSEGKIKSQKSKISSKTTVDVLEKQKTTLQKYLKNSKLYPIPITPSYSLTFDENWNLVIQCYLFNPNDLKGEKTAQFGRWVYIDNDGFYCLKDPVFQNLNTIIKESCISEFINHYRFWLNSQKGFETHLVAIESRLIYYLDDNDNLIFKSHTEMPKEEYKSHDFGEWVYILHQGFYSKIKGKGLMFIPSGTKVDKRSITKFIKKNQEELAHVRHFFSPTPPIHKAKLNIFLHHDNQILIEPRYHFNSGYDQTNVKLFGQYTYVKSDGFYELSLDQRVPEKYKNTTLIKKKDIPAFLATELPNIHTFIDRLDPRLEEAIDGFWTLSHIEKNADENNFEIQLQWRTEKGYVNALNIFEGIKNKDGFLFTNAGLIDLADPRFDWLKKIDQDQINTEKDSFSLSSLSFIRLDALQGVKEDITLSEKGIDVLKDLRDFTAPIKPSLRGFKCKLRPYQKIGLNWLWFLSCYGLSGILCDDMGLGKTHQTMALMAAIKSNKQDTKSKRRIENRKKFLIICPTSVIYHWEDKLKTFFPSLKVLTFHGLGRTLKPFGQKYDVLLTSYGILRLEKEALAKIPFALAVFDEIQIAKNYRSQTFAAITNLKAKMRLGLTGTPIENSLRELKSLFDLTLPSFMPSEEMYRQLFVNPIERENNTEQKKLLTRFIRPFILRRKKSDVLQELPPKTVEIAHCELTLCQMRLYHENLSKFREDIIRDLEDTEKSVPYMHIFSLLNSLKQICNHPACFLNDVKNYRKYSSGKWELFKELLHEARESSHKVVVFSQYLAMLDIIESYLKDEGVSFAAIRGSTTDRKQQLEKFHKDPDCTVFVGSLKAVGLGVDLTPASVVFHYDRWWNAAREDQATDRVHRIGQRRGVQVFKLMTKGTLEVTIGEIIERKGKLMEDIVTKDSHTEMKVFNRKDLIQLLQYVHSDSLDIE